MFQAFFLENILKPHIILSRPQLGENIGATARIMYNFGLESLRLISPRDGWPNKKATTVSSGGGSVVDNAIIFDDLNDSINDLNFVFATTIRTRKYSKKVFNPENGLNYAKKLLEKGNSVGILFGSERAGLEKHEISSSNAIISIPVSEKFKSLNLSHAVAVISYEWFKTIQIQDTKKSIFKQNSEYVTKNDVENFILRLKLQLNKKGYFWPEDKSDSLELNIDNLFHGLKLTKSNLKTLSGIIRSLEK